MSSNMIVHSGSIGVKDVTLVLDTAAYSTGDVLAVPQAVVQVVGAKALHSLLLLDEDDQAQGVDLIFFNASASLGTINAAVSISDADARKIVGVVSVATADYVDLVNSQVAMKSSLGMVLQGAGSSLWVGAVSRGTGTYTAAGIKLKLGFV